jgi:hypothetical protein
MIYYTNIGSGERPEGIITSKLCKCGCGEFVIHSFNRIRRGQEPPNYKWGHHGRITLKKYRFKKGNIPWDKGVNRPKSTCEKISKAKKGKHLPGMFEKGHTTNLGKHYKKRSKTLSKMDAKL